MKSTVVAWLAAGIMVLSAESLAAPPPASAFAALPEMSMVRLSPNGQRVAWANDPGGTPLVVVFDLATGQDIKRLRPANARVRDLVERGVADPKRVCIVGGSYGGYAALAGAAFTPELYACAISVNGVTDIPQMAGFIRERRGDDSDAFRAWRDLIGDPSEQDIIAFSPSRSVDTIRTPILLIHATEDTVVPASQSRIFSQLLRQRGKAQQLIELPGEDHWLSSGPSRLTVLESLETFLATHLR